MFYCSDVSFKCFGQNSLNETLAYIYFFRVRLGSSPRIYCTLRGRAVTQQLDSESHTSNLTFSPKLIKWRNPNLMLNITRREHVNYLSANWASTFIYWRGSSSPQLVVPARGALQQTASILKLAVALEFQLLIRVINIRWLRCMVTLYHVDWGVLFRFLFREGCISVSCLINWRCIRIMHHTYGHMSVRDMHVYHIKISDFCFSP